MGRVNRQRAWARIEAGAVVLAVLLSACASGASSGASGSMAAIPAAVPTAGPVGPISAPGGPFLHDATGRTVLFHGVDLMDKLAPYEIVTSGHGFNVLTTAEVRAMAADGFDAVRLGIFWKGLEPGTAPMNDPSICSPGHPGPPAPGQFNAHVFTAYMAKLTATIDLLGRAGIYSLVDMHQDVLNEVFAGEGFPNWAVCTDGITPVAHRNVADWSQNQQDPGVAQAEAHFWTNNVVGNLQGAYDRIWARVASSLAANPYVVGYDLYNEPYTSSILSPVGHNASFDAEVQCFYTGSADPGQAQGGTPIGSCPPDDPRQGLIPTIERADPHHAVFYEPDTTTSGGIPNRIGPMDFPRLGLSFHDYCFLHVPNGPEPSDYAQVCPGPENTVITEAGVDRRADATPAQPGGPAWLLTEFGATTDAADLARVVADADAHLVGWMYWQWLRYPDPTGSHDSGLWPPGPATGAQLDALSEPYAQAVAGTPTSMAYDPATRRFQLAYRPDPAVRAPTVVFVPVTRHYPAGYCASVTGGRVTSAPGAAHLDVATTPGASSVRVTVSPGPCRH